VANFTEVSMKKLGFVLLTAFLAISCLVLLGCSEPMGVTGNGNPSEPGNGNPSELRNGIPSELRNTSWSRQVSGTEAVTLSFGSNRMSMASNGDSRQYNDQWDFLGGSCCGYGYCGFVNGQYSLGFRYACSNNTLTIANCNMPSLNGSWTKE
jgi:hypothetical protein